MTCETMTVEDRARFLLEAAEHRVRRTEEDLERRAKAIARRGDEWKARGDPSHEHASVLVFLRVSSSGRSIALHRERT